MTKDDVVFDQGKTNPKIRVQILEPLNQIKKRQRRGK